MLSKWAVSKKRVIILKCIKCRKEIPDSSLYCNHCGKKQTAIKAKTHKRSHGTGTISRDKRYKKQWIAHAPASSYTSSRVYLGCYATRQEAQDAIDEYIKNGRPDLFNATLGDVYKLWSSIHFQRVSQSAVNLYTSMWKRYEPISSLLMRDVRTAHFQSVVNQATSKSAADTLKVMACMLCKFAMENDILSKNYGDFIKTPKFQKKEKRIFSKEEIAVLWEHSDDKRVQVILFMIYTGLRIGELATLKVSDVHLDGGYIICGEKTDAGRNRLVPLPPNIPELFQFVRSWMEDAKGEKVIDYTANYIREEYFYHALIDIGIIKGHKPKDSSAYKLEGNYPTPHSTRHTFASLSSAAGLKPENLQKIIGHANFNTTADVYIHQDTERLIEEMSKLTK